MKALLYVGLTLCFISGFFWRDLIEGQWYKMNAFSFFLLSIFLFFSNRNSFICYLWLCYSFSNLMDEFFFNPLVIGMNEKFFIITVPIIWFIKKYYARKITK